MRNTEDKYKDSTQSLLHGLEEENHGFHVRHIFSRTQSDSSLLVCIVVTITDFLRQHHIIRTKKSSTYYCDDILYIKSFLQV